MRLVEAVEYLGHIIKAGTIMADLAKVFTIKDWPIHIDIKYL